MDFIRDGFNKVNLNSVGVYIECMHDNYTSINDIMEDFLAASSKNQPKELGKIIYLQSMLKNIYELIYISMFSSEDEIYFSKDDSEEWQHFLGHIEVYDPFPDDRRVVKSYSKF